MSATSPANPGRSARGADSRLQESLAPRTYAFDITAPNQTFYVPMGGRDKLRAQLGSRDGKAVTLGTCTIDCGITLNPHTPGRGSTKGEQIPFNSPASDWVDSGTDLSALGAFLDVTGPAALARFTVTALTGLTSGNLQLWVL